jgi:uncharacterized damage-inducible protein DinB
MSENLSHLHKLVDHMEWADAEVWRAVLANEAARHDARLRNLLTHLHVVQRLFLMLWTKQQFDSSGTPPEFPGLSELRTWAVTYYPEAHRFLEGLDESRLPEEVFMPWLKTLESQLGRPLAMPTLGETVLQVSSHSTYHRGQVNARLRDLGGEPPLVDYIAWIWFGRPAPNWSATPTAA